MTIGSLDHLPITKQRELQFALKVLFDTFDDAVRTKLSARRKSGQILKVILFGSMARGDWVDDKHSGYKSDFDLLVIVNGQSFTDLHEYWSAADERFVRDFTITHNIDTPVNFIVHDLADVNDQLARGRPFFTDIVRDGIVLYEASGHPLAKPKALTPDEVMAEAQGYYKQWFKRGSDFIAGAGFHRSQDSLPLAAFNLHQAVEALYHCVLLVLTLYSPKSHRITMLRSQAEALDDRLKGIWPAETKLHRQAFDRLRRAYVEARYSADYTVTDEELDWLTDRVKLLQDTVAALATERLNPANLTN
ncbi:nucleotidyltransferase and HEPN domain-containing protein [Asticcacaulis excentricus]|uniref:HEPN domain protein n=1 Tax=Asticcacaulis excentricus (strain ATCC 15261 / DSM 4724 / KCTC 12464 / NCIMB 9791 / VKM B-1370 / CB 48) TaxID=573065 RepID=E8RNE6_ASTEC|nr:nucleotidyltransferase and HEPN domain-containing protein [Asticcacaulis excentricus]ADU11777.1 HEPN domain protein [Asticcacaulis excentricus CB 48]